MILRQVFAEIHAVLFTCLWRDVTETEPAENAPCLFSLFYKSTLFCCYDDCTQINVDTLLLSVRSKLTGVFLVIFVGIKKHWWGLWPQGVKRGLNLVGLNFWYTIWDMIWYDIALYCQTDLKFFLRNSIYAYNNKHPLNNNIHFIHTRIKHIIHYTLLNIKLYLTLLLHLYNYTMFTILLIFD